MRARAVALVLSLVAPSAAFGALAACTPAPAPSPSPSPAVEAADAARDGASGAASAGGPAGPAGTDTDAPANADAGPPSTADAATAARDASAGAPDGMLFVPGGTFTMGADSGGEADEHPAHSVTVKPFFLDRTEVTQSAYDACVAAKACAPADAAALATFGGLFKGPHKPIVGVSWFDATKYCDWRGARLPREAEFERAVRGDDGRRFPWGSEPPTHERTVFEANAPEDVGTHPSGRGPYGHDDLAGNVWEWIADDYDPFAYTRPRAAEGEPGTCAEIKAAQDELRAHKKQGFTGSNPIPTGCDKSIRGGAYNYPGAGLRSSNRVHHPPGFKLRMTGFRCAKDAPAR